MMIMIMMRRRKRMKVLILVYPHITSRFRKKVGQMGSTSTFSG